MKKLICLSVSAILFANVMLANNLTVSNIVVTQNAGVGGTVAFTLSWDNSWRVALAPTNWDAVWVFVKFKDCLALSNVAFTHGTLSATTSAHSFGANLEAMTTINAAAGSTVQGATLDDATGGIMLRRNTAGSGTISSNVSLYISNLPANTMSLSTKVIGIEMVYCPQYDFYLGDATSDHRFRNTAADNNPMLITSAFEIAASNFYLIDPAIPITGVPAAWPKGYYGFYIMKYEIPEELYVTFLNTLNQTQQLIRYPGNLTFRNQTQFVSGTTYLAGRPDRAQNWLSWSDFSALLDWAALRPPTELEWEKAARGSAGWVAGEYAWGNTTISNGNTFTGSPIFSGENGTEVLTTGNSNCVSVIFVNGDGGQGPVRAGIFSTSSSTRTTAGASYYGAMEMSGNIIEFTVAMHSTPASNVYTRTWGDGSIDVLTANHNIGVWPAAGTTTTNFSTANLIGMRGGFWGNAVAELRISTRHHVYEDTRWNRDSWTGGRGAR
ncbi:MAG: SUMF1/EgtB/PvdO family nonheme iron enzyme [Bacteroidota bacterium]